MTVLATQFKSALSQRQLLQHTVQAFFQRFIQYPACTLVCGKHSNQ